MNAVAETTTQATTGRFLDNGDGTVRELARQLEWSRETVCQDEMNHASAEKLCADYRGGGHADWRLPTVEELFLLADRSRQSPAIDVDVFPDTRCDWYWTSTIAAWSSDVAWIVHFGFGYANGVLRGYGGGFVRAVRSVPAGQ